jgi:hypothetical protein
MTLIKPDGQRDWVCSNSLIMWFGYAKHEECEKAFATKHQEAGAQSFREKVGAHTVSQGAGSSCGARLRSSRRRVS